MVSSLRTGSSVELCDTALLRTPRAAHRRIHCAGSTALARNAIDQPDRHGGKTPSFRRRDSDHICPSTIRSAHSIRRGFCMAYRSQQAPRETYPGQEIRRTSHKSLRVESVARSGIDLHRYRRPSNLRFTPDSESSAESPRSSNAARKELTRWRH